jgi:hypothetical protein
MADHLMSMMEQTWLFVQFEEEEDDTVRSGLK